MSEIIRIEPLDGTWQTLGRGTLLRAEPKGIAPTWSVRGPDTLGFDLSVDAIRSTIELREFTPVEYFNGGDEPLWSGFIFDAPRRSAGGDTGVSVSCQGWQHHLEDDSHASVYVHRALSDWADTRGYPSDPTQLVRFVSPPSVTSEGGYILLQFPKGTPVALSDIVGVTIDQGADSAAWATSFDLTVDAIGTGLTSNFKLYVRLSDGIETITASGTFLVDRHDAVSAATSIVPWGGSLGGARRYITIMFVRDAGADIPSMATDEGVRITKMILYRQSAYRASTESTLSAHQVFAAEATHAPLLSTDTSMIETASFNIPSLGAYKEDATPLDMMTRADSYHRYRWGVDARRRVFFGPQPATPQMVVNTRDAGVDYKDASHNSGADVYNKVIVTGTSGAGESLRIVRYSANLPGADYLDAFGITVPNGSFTVDTSGWGLVLGATSTVTRDTGVFNTTPASGRFNWGTESASFALSITGTFKAGTTYRVLGNLRGTSSSKSVLQFGDFTTGDTNFAGIKYKKAYFYTLDLSTFGGFSEHWSPDVDTSSVSVVLYHFGSAASQITYLDDVTITQGFATMPDRRGFTRSKSLEVQAPTDETTMEILGDLFLEAHRRPPFKGSLDLTSSAAADVLTGRRLTPHEVASRTGELIRLADVIDPYTGERGRDAIMASATGGNGGDTASISLDSDRTSFEALMSRMAVVQTASPR